MFVINDDLSIYVTRGDTVFFLVTAEENGADYVFKAGEVLRIKVYGKKNAENVVLQKDFPIAQDTPQVYITLTEQDTKFGNVISKPTDYWYEVELNPFTNPQTIIGYDDDGAKVFRLFPEGDDVPEFVPDPEDLKVIDTELDMTSTRPVQNQAIARAMTVLKADFAKTREQSNDTAKAIEAEKTRIDNLVSNNVTSTSAVLAYLEHISSTTKSKIDGRIESDGVFADVQVNLHEANLIYGGTDMDVFIIPNECRPIDLGVIHTEDGMEYSIKYDNANNRYVLNLRAQDSVTVAPSGACVVNMSYALANYEVKDIRVGADGVTYDSAGAAVRGQIEKLERKVIGINYMGRWVEGGYTNKFGEFVESSSYSDSEKVPCLPNETYVVEIKFPYGINAGAILSVFNFYNANGAYVSGHPTVLEDSPAICVVDEETNTTTYILTVPDDDSIRFFTTYASNVHWEKCSFCCTHGKTNNYRFNGSMPISAVYFDKKISRKYIEGLAESNEGLQWEGKNWFAFGTSITDTSYMNTETGTVTGKFVPYIVALSGLNVTNYGIAGGCIGSGGIHGGTSNILNRILETDLSEADLITIEGFVNDFACAVEIGDVGDTENTTICGALYQAIKYCLENSHATVVLLTESYGKEYTLQTTGSKANYCVDRKNSLGLLQMDYNNAIVKMGAYMGVPVIDCGAKSHINNFHPEYIIDQIHHTELGGQQYANTVWNELKNITPLVVGN